MRPVRGARPGALVLAAADTDLLAADLAAAVPTVVGFRGRVSDAACIEFVRGFYLALAPGAPSSRPPRRGGLDVARTRCGTGRVGPARGVLRARRSG